MAESPKRKMDESGASGRKLFKNQTGVRMRAALARPAAEVGALERQKHTLEQSVARAESYLAQQTQALTADQGI